jgi:hypothetical protein
MVKISPIDPNTLAPQTFSSEDSNIIQSTITSSLFNVKTDTVEYFIYDLNNNLLVSNPNYNNWSVISDPSLASTKDSISTIEIDPVVDLNNFGYNFGAVKSVYNFVSNKLTSSPTNKFYISEISSDRTELRLKSNFISNDSLQIAYEQFKTELNSSEFFDEFYLNFGDNQLVLAVNILLDNSTSQYSLLIKLYSALPQTFQLKAETYVITKSAESVGFEVEFENIVDVNAGLSYIKPANFNLDIFDQINNTTDYKNYNTLLNTNNSGSLYQLINYISGSDIQVNVDYSNYTNFINFSSAAQRLFNFQTKIYSISASQAQLNTLSSSISGPTSASIVVSSSKAILENQIQTTIGSFDKYEYYLYYNSESKTWPKQNSTAPYILFDPTSSQAINWYATQSVTASLYDSNNQNYLYYTIPQFIREDSSNDPYLVFVDLVGQLFDEIWLYTKNITDKLDSNNNLNLGVSKDIVADVLKSLGIKLYASNFTADNLYNTLIGANPNGGSLLPTGSELITNYITSSISASLVPTIDDYNKLIYKKIYHNLPYLLKKKGTPQGLKALINIFGVPDTILRINEFGGKDKNLNTFDQWQNEFSYAFITTGSSAILTPFTASSSPYGTTFPKAIEFRFKTSGLPTSSIPYSQSLFVNSGSTVRFGVFLEYTGSGYTSGSYNGSIKDTNYQYATLKFISGSLSSSVYLPFYDGDWWSVLINVNSSSTTTYTLYAKNKIYDGVDGNIIGFQASSSFTGTNFWRTPHQLFFGTGSVLNGKTYTNFSGSYQEIRYYNVPLSESTFDAYVMNPSSIEGNTISGSQSSKNSLFFRLPLGGELYTGSTSIHPSITGSFVTQSFTGAPSTGSFSGSFTWGTNREIIYFDQPAVGIQNIVSNKIRTANIVLPLTSSVEANIPNNKTLSPYISIQQKYSISSSYTDDVNYTEIGLSPQNEINEDIMSTLGFFNMGDLIGDPRQVGSKDQSYYDLDILRNLYFEKYASNYDWNDFIRLIQFFDNSLFKMVKDYIPAKSSLASGIIIKQHILERNKYPVPQMEFTQSDYTGSISMYTITGSDGGSWPDLSSSLQFQITQSWTGSYSSYSGSIPFTRDDLSEFFNGELSGSNFVVSTQSLNSNNSYTIQLNPDITLFELSPYNVLVNNVSSSTLSSFFMDVDYSNGAVLPINQQLLLDGNAFKFEIPDSNYTSYKNTALRYDGSKTTSPNFNKPIYNRPSDAFINNQYSIVTPSTQSQEPNASRYSNYFIYFDYIETAFPEVPGGSNIHAVYAITTEGTAIPLTGDNVYVDEISNIFVKGTLVNILPAVYAAGKKNPQVTILEGGAKFQTICALSGSTAGKATGSFDVDPNNDLIVLVTNNYRTFFSTGSGTIGPSILADLTDTDTDPVFGQSDAFLDALTSSQTGNFGDYSLTPGGQFYIYDKSQNSLVGNINPNTVTASSVDYINTLFPLTTGDIIRFGDARKSGSRSGSLDISYNGLQRVQFGSIDTSENIQSVPSVSASIANLILGGIYTGPTRYLNQNYRIFRRIPDETNIVITTQPSFNDPGFLIPENFNPAYNPYELAQKAGIIA